ncbi:MAG: hypothetical protein RJQ08_03805 [Salinisphaeraceae bacterium]
MAQPTKFVQSYDFSDYQTASPNDPLPAAQLDTQFGLLKTTTDELIDNIALIQKDDGTLANASVGIDQLTADVDIGFRTITDWLTATAYVLRDGVFTGGALYRCIVAHTSGTFSTDLAAAKWVLIYDFADAPGFTIGTDIQAWDAQLDDIAALAVTDGNFIVGDGANWVAESGATARTSLGLGSLAVQSTINDDDWSGADLAIGNGGTGASTAGAARTALGVEIGSDVQAYSAVLAALVAGTVDGVVIGGSTPAASTATTSTATTEFRGPILTSNAASDVEIKTSGGTQFKAIHRASAVNFGGTQGGATGGAVFWYNNGSDANVGAGYITKGSGAHTFYSDLGGGTQFNIARTASAVEYLEATGATTGGTPTLSAAGAASNLDIGLSGKGTGGVRLGANFARYATFTGSAGGAVTLTASDGNFVLSTGGGGAGLQSPNFLTILTGTAVPAGGTAGAGYKFSSTSNFGVFFGSGAPTLAAAQGSLYLRSDGSSTSTRAYINTDGSTTWTALTTAA